MRRCFAALAAVAALPGLAACAGPAATARLDDACVFSQAEPEKSSTIEDRAPTGTMGIGMFYAVPYQVVSASLARTHRIENESCSRRVG